MNIMLGLLYLCFIGLFLAVLGFLIKNVIPRYFGTLNFQVILGIVVGSVLALITLRWGPYLAMDALLEGWKMSAPKMVEFSNIIIRDMTGIVEGVMPTYETTSSTPFTGLQDLGIPEYQPNLQSIVPPTPVYSAPPSSGLHTTGGLGNVDMGRPGLDGQPDNSTNGSGGGTPFDYETWELGDPIPTPMVTPQAD